MILLHGAMVSGERAWAAQSPLASAWRLVVPARRGFHPNPPAERCDFDADVDDLEPLIGDGAHLVGHSYGGLVAMLLAVRHPERVRSLALIEPAAHALVPDALIVRDTVRRYDELPVQNGPEDFLDAFLAFLGTPAGDRRRPMSSVTAQHVGMAMRERRPWTASLVPADLAAPPFPVLVLSGGRGDVWDVVASAAADAYAGGSPRPGHVRRAVITGAPHDVQSSGGRTNDLLRALWHSVDRSSHLDTFVHDSAR